MISYSKKDFVCFCKVLKGRRYLSRVSILPYFPAHEAGLPVCVRAGVPPVPFYPEGIAL